MKRESEIRRKVSQVAYRHLKHALEDNFRKVPDGCFHQTRELMDDGATIGLCGLAWHDRHFGLPLCDSRFQSSSIIASGCPKWTPKRTKLEVRDAFRLLLASGRVAVAVKYPDLAALHWALDEDDILGLLTDDLPEDPLKEPESNLDKKPEPPPVQVLLEGSELAASVPSILPIPVKNTRWVKIAKSIQAFFVRFFHV